MVDESSPPKRTAVSVLRTSGGPPDRQGGTPFEEFYRSEYQAVLVLARVLTGDPHTAQDVTHAAAKASWMPAETETETLHLTPPPPARNLTSSGIQPARGGMFWLGVGGSGLCQHPEEPSVDQLAQDLLVDCILRPRRPMNRWP